MENSLLKVVKKYSSILDTEANYYLGGGLSEYKYESVRHAHAKSDKSRLTLGQAVQVFKKATNTDIDLIKEILNLAVPNMEWHHAGFLPKSYGGGMKKTYFIKSSQIVDVAENFNKYLEQIQIREKKTNEDYLLAVEKLEMQKQFLMIHAFFVSRTKNKPLFFYETQKEYNGKYGWFNAENKNYNLPIYYSGYEFDDEFKYLEFINLL